MVRVCCRVMCVACVLQVCIRVMCVACVLQSEFCCNCLQRDVCCMCVADLCCTEKRRVLKCHELPAA